MKTWILAAGLLSIAPLSDLMYRASPSPPPAAMPVELIRLKPPVPAEPGAYDAAQRKAMRRIEARAERELENRRGAETYALVYDVTSDNINSDIFGGDTWVRH